MGKFGEKYGFGVALSLNVAKAEYDDYAEELRKQLYPEVKTTAEEKADPEPAPEPVAAPEAVKEE